MTTEKAKKQAVRARLAQAGESYTEALRHVEGEEQRLNLVSLFLADQCANCDATLSMENQTLFCSEFCMQVGSFVRYARRVIVDPTRANDPGVKETMQIRMAHLIGGGYSERARRLTSDQRAMIIGRDQGRCRRCGADRAVSDRVGAMAI